MTNSRVHKEIKGGVTGHTIRIGTPRDIRSQAPEVTGDDRENASPQVLV